MALSDTDWVALAFLVFIGILFYLKVPKAAMDGLDKRSQAIEEELNNARALREEAQALLASYQRRQAEAEKEAQAIVEQAEKDAKALAETTRVQLSEQMERRTLMAEQKIAQAEAQAVQDVRNAAISVAVDAARTVVKDQLSEGQATKLVEDNIAELKQNIG